MLSKFKSLPLEMKFSTLFLLAVAITITVLIPPLALAIALGLGILYSIHTILVYLDR